MGLLGPQNLPLGGVDSVEENCDMCAACELTMVLPSKASVGELSWSRFNWKGNQDEDWI